MLSPEGQGGYRKVANKNDLKEGTLMRVDVAGRPIVMAMVKGKVYAMDAVCSHEGGPLEEGTLDEYELKCPWHYAVFDVRNAKVSDQTVWATDLQSYPVKVDDTTGDILVSVGQAKQEESVQPQRTDRETAAAQENERKFYEEEERKAQHKRLIKLVSVEGLEGTDIMSFRFERNGIDYSAGQYGYFKLDSVSGDPKGPIRHFTFASSPTEQDLMISTRIRDTPYKKRLASLEAGTEVKVWGPQGEFILHEDYTKPAVFLSGGIGVTPFRSMIKYATDEQLSVQIVMFDSNRNVKNILYKSEFDEWASRNKNLKIIYGVTDANSAGWTGEKGRIDKDMITRHIDPEALSSAIFYICGPPAMLKAMRQILESELKIPNERIKIEEFTGY
jgi:ferredoxin-NADP reductase/nitrite reductase/ring-hydroxylating ferredoxin subunit